MSSPAPTNQTLHKVIFPLKPWKTSEAFRGKLWVMSKKIKQSATTAKPWEHAKSGSGSAHDPLAARFVESISYDTRMYKQDIAGSVAHATMLCEVGLINKKELSQIKKGLKEISKEIDEQGLDWDGWQVELEDVHMCVEAALIAKIGDAGRKLHTGRSRNDQVALDLKLWIEDASADLSKQFDSLFKNLVKLAKRDGKIVMPSYTHLQRAQPIVVGGEILAWLTALDRCEKRIAALRQINNENPIGSGAIAGSGLPLDRKITSDLLPLGEPTPNSIDATASRDAALDMVYSLAMISQTLSRWAEQWIIYMTEEFGFLKIGEAYTTGSSMMPQKRNPDMLELIRGRCGNVYGNLVAMLTMVKGTPIAYNRDLQEDKRHLFAAYDMVSDCLEMASRIIATAVFQEERIKSTLHRGFLDATALADYLVTCNVPFRTAHQIVGALVRKCEDRNLEQLSDLLLEDFNHACIDAGQKANTCNDEIYSWLGASNVVKRYKSSGNAGLTGFTQQIKVWEERLKTK